MESGGEGGCGEALGAPCDARIVAPTVGYETAGVPTSFLHFETDTDRMNTLAEDPLGFGVRLIEMTSDEKAGTWEVRTRISLTNGTYMHEMVLAEGRL